MMLTLGPPVIKHDGMFELVEFSDKYDSYVVLPYNYTLTL